MIVHILALDETLSHLVGSCQNDITIESFRGCGAMHNTTQEKSMQQYFNEDTIWNLQLWSNACYLMSHWRKIPTYFSKQLRFTSASADTSQTILPFNRHDEFSLINIFKLQIMWWWKSVEEGAGSHLQLNSEVKSRAAGAQRSSLETEITLPWAERTPRWGATVLTLL